MKLDRQSILIPLNEVDSFEGLHLHIIAGKICSSQPTLHSVHAISGFAQDMKGLVSNLQIMGS